MLNPNLDTGIDSILNPYIESTSLVYVPITTNDEIPPSSVTTLPPPLIPLIQPLVKSLEDDFSEFKQTNLFAKTVSSIPDRLREEAQAKNQDFLNKIDESMKKIIKEQVKVQVKEQDFPRFCQELEKFQVNEQLQAEVLIRSSNEAKKSHAVAANLSELELKKILIDKMENNKSIDILVQQKTLVDTYEIDKDILATYGDTVTFKRRRDDEDEDDEPSVGSNRGKRRKAEKNLSLLGLQRTRRLNEQVHTVNDLEEPAHQEFETSFTDDHHVDETTQFPDWFQKPTKPPTPDRDWNKTLPANHGLIQPWISTLA
ncbi:hypothetical protein Tco_1014340 [Tanacetum coccineum]